MFHIQKEKISDSCQVLELSQTNFNRYFSHSSEGIVGKVRLFIFDPIRAYLYDDDDGEYYTDEKKLDSLRFDYLGQLKALNEINRMKQTTDAGLNGVKILSNGFIAISENNEYRFIGYFIAVNVSKDVINLKLAKQQMETLHKNCFSSISSTEAVEESELAMQNGNICFLRLLKLNSPNPGLFEAEQEALSEFIESK